MQIGLMSTRVTKGTLDVTAATAASATICAGVSRSTSSTFHGIDKHLK